MKRSRVYTTVEMMSSDNSKSRRMLDHVRKKMVPLRELVTREMQDTRVDTAVEFVEQNTPQITRSMGAFDSGGIRELLAETVGKPVVKKASSLLEGVLRRKSPSSERLRRLAAEVSQNSDLTKAICGLVTSAVTVNFVGMAIGTLKVVREAKSTLDRGKQVSRERRRFEQIRSKLDQVIERHGDKLKRIEGLNEYVKGGWKIAVEGNPVPLLMTVAADLSRVITHVKESRGRIEAEREAERREAERREAERRYWATRCGARTLDGGNCKNPVAGGGRCHVHS